MTLEKFRIVHSTLIEHYQFIETHLEEIYAAVCGKPLLEGLKDVEKDGLSGILGDILRVERERKIDVLSDEECEQLRQLFTRRNFWCHSCYCQLAFDLKTGGPARITDAQQMLEDLRTAEHWRQQLFERKLRLIKKNHQQNR